jgi:hypothetical protein
MPRSPYEAVTKNPPRAINFGRIMQFFSLGEGYEITSLVVGYWWAKLGNGTVVDTSFLISNYQLPSWGL